MTWDSNKNIVGSAGSIPIVSENRNKPNILVVALLILILLVLLALVGGIGFMAYQFITLPQRMTEGAKKQFSTSVKEMRETGAAVAARIGEALNFTPTVVMGDDVVLHGSADVRHLVLRETTFTQERAFSHTFLGSTKRLEVHAEFRARSGIDLGRQTRIVVEERGVIVELPEPEVLSVEMGELMFVQDADGLWNRIRPDERQEHINTLIMRAQETASRLLPAEEVRDAARKTLQNALSPMANVPVEVVFRSNAPDISKKDGILLRPMN